MKMDGEWEEGIVLTLLTSVKGPVPGSDLIRQTWKLSESMSARRLGAGIDPRTDSHSCSRQTILRKNGRSVR